MNKRIASFGIVAGLAVSGGAGLALSHAGGASAGTVAVAAPAADSSTDTTVAGSTSSTAPAGTTTKTPMQPGDREKAALDPLVAAGTITQAQEDAVIKALEAARPSGGPMGGPMGGGPGGRHGGPGGMQFDVAAKAIGITADDLRTAVKGGQTVAAVATSKGVSPQTVIDALVADLKTREAAEVTAGKETQAQSDTEIADATTRITTWVNSTPAAAADGGPGHGGAGYGGAGYGGASYGGPGRGGRDGAPAPAAPTSQAPTTTTA